MEVLEKDSYLPSFKIHMCCTIKHPTGSIVYDANDIWFDCTQWDKFIDQLSQLNEQQGSATLSNLSDYITICIYGKEGVNVAAFFDRL